jgi:hypothetical protein
METPAQKLIRHWKADGLAIAPPATEDDLMRFELLHEATLPFDVRDYFLAVNGMLQKSPHDTDSEMFTFWPLQMMTRVTDEPGLGGPQWKSPTGWRPEKYFLFVDYMQSCWAYAIRLDGRAIDRGEVVDVGTLKPRVVARSFSEFVDMYVRDWKELYPDR